MTMENILRTELSFILHFMCLLKKKRSKWKTLDGQLVDPVKPAQLKIAESL